MDEFETELETFRQEEEAAQQYFFAYLALNNVPAESKFTLDALNLTPQFWRTVRHGSLVAAFITLGRIFDEAHGSHSVNTLLKVTERNLSSFSRSSLAVRKTSSSSLTTEEAEEYARDKHELSIHDVREMRKAVGRQRTTWKKDYADIRHMIFAHRDKKAHEDSLYKQTNVGEFVELLAFLAKLYEALYQGYHNGRAPDLTPDGPTFPISEFGEEPGELVYREAAEALELLAKSHR